MSIGKKGEMIHYSLFGLLSEGHVLILHRDLGLLSHLAPAETSWPSMLAQQQFTKSELSLLHPLLEQYPHYCPHEVLFASFYHGIVTEKTIALANERLQEAAFAGVWDHEMRSLRNTLSRTRQKLKDFGLDARSILETGYMLKRIVL